MPRFEPDMTKARASIRVFERGEYEVAIGDPQGILYEHEQRGHIVAGVRYPLEMVGRIKADGELDDEFAEEAVTPIRLYVHSEKAWPITKRFIMAAAGYALDEEDDFNEEWLPVNELTIDGEPAEDAVELGSGWSEISGNHLWLTLDSEEYEGNEQQRHTAFQPVGS